MKQFIQTKMIWRGWKTNKLFVISAIASLIIGITCCNLLIAFVINEVSISEGSPCEDQIFVLKTDNPMTMESTKEQTSFSLPQVPPLLLEHYPEVEAYCRFQSFNDDMKFESTSFLSLNVAFLGVDEAILNFFTVPVLQGDLSKTLSSPDEAGITVSFAQKAFGTLDVIGKTFLMQTADSEELKRITSIVDDRSISSYITYDVLLPIDEASYFGGVCFFKLHSPNDRLILEEKLEKDRSELPKFDDRCHYYLQSLHDFYFDKAIQTNWTFLLKRDRLILYVGIVSALLILLIACFNFVHLYLVRLHKSTITNSIHKIMGARNIHIISQMLVESFMMVTIAYIISFFLICMFLPQFNTLFSAHISLAFMGEKVLVLCYLLLFVLLTALPMLFLYGKLSKASRMQQDNRKKEQFSRSMIGLQFCGSILLIMATLVYNKQINFITEAANIDPNVFEIIGADFSYADMKIVQDEMDTWSSVKLTSIANTTFLNSWMVLGDDGISTIHYQVEPSFLAIHNIALKAGRGISSKADEVLVNETFINKIVPNATVGSHFTRNGREYTIVGIVKDFHTLSFTAKIQAAMFEAYQHKASSMGQVLHVKCRENNRTQVIAEVQQFLNDSYPEKIFTYEITAESFATLHKKYAQMQKMVMYFTMISFLLTFIGLFGISWYAVECRTKEIGIRKVNGATTSEILLLLNADFIKWVAIAFIIACPIAYYAMNRWLENFAYKTDLSWWIFALAGVLALGIALLTVSFQSIKAARRNPIESLRYE